MYKFLYYLGKSFNVFASLMLLIEAKIVMKRGKLQGFITHTMDPSFNYKPFTKKINPYYKQWGFKFSMVEAEYYKRMNGVESNLYIPYTFFTHYLIPFLNGDGKYLDKNSFRMVLGANNPNKKVNFKMPLQIVYNRRGVFYDCNDECCSYDEAVKKVLAYNKDIIVKPTQSSTWGKGVIKLKVEGKTEEMIKNLFDSYRRNFSFEECIIQHSDMATLNESSLNTTRIATYRKPSGEIKYLYSFQRFGKKGEVIDNASAGGNFVGVADDGTLDRIVKSYRTMKTWKLKEEVTTKIPYFERIKEVAIYLHSKLPDVNYIGWDFSITQDGVPVVIELNHRSAVDPSQIASGPAFSKEDLDEIMPMLAKYKAWYKAVPMIKIPGGKGYCAALRY